MAHALDDFGTTNVPCDGCTACCSSSQFVEIGPEEQATLARIPSELLFPAPGRPAGFVVLGYDEHGCCPMLVDGGCSIYDDRPRACQVYDCRIFPATGFEPDDKPLVAERARRWRFDVSSAADTDARDALAAAAQHVRDRRDRGSATEAAVLTIRVARSR
jgi:Fe-S-cluster containining protein